MTNELFIINFMLHSSIYLQHLFNVWPPKLDGNDQLHSWGVCLYICKWWLLHFLLDPILSYPFTSSGQRVGDSKLDLGYLTVHMCMYVCMYA